MKKILGMMAVFAAVGSFAGTYTWTGSAGDGMWFTAGNWNYDGEAAANAPANNCSDDVTIDGPYEVSYQPGNDLQLSGTLTLKNGASFTQIVGEAYSDLKGGTIHVFADSVFDTGTMSGSNGMGLGNLIIEDGGKVIVRNNIARNSLVVKEGGVYEMTGNYTFKDTDDIQAGGTLKATGNILIPAGVVISSKGTIETTGEFQPSNGAEFRNANMTCQLASMAGIASLLSGSIVFTDPRDIGGLWQGGTDTLYFDFPQGSTCSITIAATGENAYARTFGTNAATPRYRYNGEAISAAQFVSLFDVTDNGDGTVTIKPASISEDAPELESASIVIGAQEGSANVYATFTSVGDPVADVYLAYADTDRGRKIADWGEQLISLGKISAEGIVSATAEGLTPRQRYAMRVFAVNEEGSTVSEVTWLYLRDYGIQGTVNEFLGTSATSTSLSDAANWSLGHVPTNGEIRWFENCEVVVNGNFTPNATDEYRGGRFTVNGELQPVNGCTFRGTDFTVTRIAPQQSPAAFTAVAGTFVITSNGNSFWNNDQADRYCEIPNGSTASFTFPMTRAAFVGGYLSKFRNGGAVITAEDFADADTWTVVETEEPASVTFNLKSQISGGPGIKRHSAEYLDGSVTVTVVPEDDCAEDTVFTVYYDTTDHGRIASAWPNHAELSEQTDGSYAVVLSDVTRNSRCYYAVEARSEEFGKSVWVAGQLVVADLPTDANVWLGKTADLTSPSNWSKGVVPSATDIVELNEFFTEGAVLNWNVAAIPQVAGWRQTAAVTVIFNTTLSSPLTISGDVSLAAGANWTHQGPGPQGNTPEYALNIVVGGDFTVAEGAYVQAGRGIVNSDIYATRGYWDNGPGFDNIFTNETEYGVIAETNRVFFGRGASFGGDGGYRSAVFTEGVSFVSYGSILNPLSYGSSGVGDGAAFAGAGIVKLEVGGTLTVNGEIAAVGFGYPNLAAALSAGASSGGSINLKAGALAGAGEINADGGADQEGGNGAGGRIRVKLTSDTATFETFTGSIHAYGGTRRDTLTVDQVLGVIDAAAGTVVKQLASDSEEAGTLVIRNLTEGRINPAGATHLPAMQDSESKLGSLRVEVAAGTNVRLTKDVRIKSLTIGGQKVKNGEYTAEQLNALTGGESFSGAGVLTIGQNGFILYVR